MISIQLRSYSSLTTCLLDSTDRKSVITISLKPQTSPQQDADLGHSIILLDLRAGAGDRRRLTGKTVDRCTEWSKPDIMSALAQEVAHTSSQVQHPATRCSMCPFRSFQRTSRLINHITKHHTPDNRYCPSGSKQFKVACALFDWHRVRREPCNALLKESAEIMRRSIAPPLPPTANSIDRDIRLVFDVDGPHYQALDHLQDAPATRRCENLHYTHAFATRFFQSMVANHANMNRTRDELIATTCEAQNPLASLLRTTSTYWWPVAEDLMKAPPISTLSDSFQSDLTRAREYESISVDDTVKICMPILGQRIPRRSSQLAPRVIVLSDDERYRCVFTTRGRTGCVLDLLPQPQNADDNLVTALTKAVPDDAKEQVTFVNSDKCSLQLHNRIGSVFPRFVMMCLDPTHLVMSYEAASARRKTAGSKLLRSIMRRFATTFNPESQQPPVCRYIFKGQRPPPLTQYELRCQNWIENKNMPLRRAQRIAKAQSEAGHWQSRGDFTEAIAALCKLFPKEVDRVSPGPNRKIVEILLSCTKWPSPYNRAFSYHTPNATTHMIHIIYPRSTLVEFQV